MKIKEKKISQVSLDENIGFIIRLGSFSYAEIPKLNFNSILGATRTLSSLNEPGKEIIEKIYKIKDKTFIPSVYGGEELDFYENDVKCVLEEIFFDEIADEIKKSQLI